MKPLYRRIYRPLIVASTFVILCVGASLWNKSNFCAGWAADYAERSAVVRQLHAVAMAEHQPDRARELQRTATMLTLIADKYNRVASNPFLSYPSNPLVTDEEIENALRVSTIERGA